MRSKRGGTLPFIELNGAEIADSSVIMKELEKKFEKNLDASLTQEQRNISHAMITMIENHLIWLLFWWRAKHPEDLLKGYKVNLQNALGIRLPNSFLNFFFKISYARKVSAFVGPSLFEGGCLKCGRFYLNFNTYFSHSHHRYEPIFESSW